MANEAVQATITEVVKQVSDTMTEAIKEYGPDAVDLAMMAYRIEALQQIVTGFICAAALAAVVCAYRKFWCWSGAKIRESRHDEDGFFLARAMLGAGVAIGGAFLLAGAIQNVVDVSAWVAVLGHPELRVAMKALVAAGLL